MLLLPRSEVPKPLYSFARISLCSKLFTATAWKKNPAEPKCFSLGESRFGRTTATDNAHSQCDCHHARVVVFCRDRSMKIALLHVQCTCVVLQNLCAIRTHNQAVWLPCKPIYMRMRQAQIQNAKTWCAHRERYCYSQVYIELVSYWRIIKWFIKSGC